jgi:tetratricopeptide (TPR) repeat protein
LFELTRPAAFALSALLSTWVLASARRHGFAFYGVAAWTLGTLFFPLSILPIYLIIRAARRQEQRASQPTEQPQEEDEGDARPAGPTIESTTEQTPEEEGTRQSRPRLRLLLPALYLLAVLLLGALFYYRDAQGVDAHLARANRARLLGQRDKTINEYRSALKLEENAHTRNLLGIELAAAGQWEEALAEFRRAEQAGEPDDELPYRIAAMLDALKRPSEAALEYRKFLATRRCTDGYPDPQCAAARARSEKKQ